MSDSKRPNHLRLVTDGPPPPPRLRRRAELSPEERARLANAIRGLRRLYGTYKRVAEEMGLRPESLTEVLSGHHGSYMMAVRAAHLAGLPVETILYGTVVATDRCPTCKQKLPEKTT
jgi:hypothetical protein